MNVKLFFFKKEFKKLNNTINFLNECKTVFLKKELKKLNNFFN